MASIYYFNINYYCNNDCIFCFSTSTGRNSHQISFEEFKRRIDSVQPEEEDKIVINGGEPSIHPDFYQILNYVCSHYLAQVIIYSNGVALFPEKIEDKSNVIFVIPIHGDEKIHNCTTRNKKSFCGTINNLHLLQESEIEYRLKFIINTTMVDTEFDLFEFLVKYSLKPSEIILARLNETIKSKRNGVSIVNNFNMIRYLDINVQKLKPIYNLKYLDIPFCFFSDFEHNTLTMNLAPKLYFNDYLNDMVEREYYKEVMIGENCENCKEYNLCKILCSTYLTISYRGGWIVEEE